MKLRIPPALQLWREIDPPPSNVQLRMTTIRGNASSRIVMIAPVPSKEEYAKGVPFTNHAAMIFHEILKEKGIPTNHVFVVPCVRWGEKALTANSKEVMNFVRTAIQRKYFSFIVSVGEDATRWIVNGGKKANMGTFAGKLVYPPNLFHRPLFVFSDPRGLVPEITGNDREDYWRKRNAELLVDKFKKQAELLRRHIQPRTNHG